MIAPPSSSPGIERTPWACACLAFLSARRSTTEASREALATRAVPPRIPCRQEPRPDAIRGCARGCGQACAKREAQALIVQAMVRDALAKGMQVCA